MIKLIKAILTKNENAAYTELANVNWDKSKKESHLKEVGLSYGLHAWQSFRSAWYFFKMFLFCAFWHPFFPNVKPHYATKRLKGFPKWYKNLSRRLRVTQWKMNKAGEVDNPFSHMGY